MKIAITGASGHIGSNLCPMLVEKGYTLKILVFNSTKGIPTENTEVVKGDITKLKDVEKLIEGVDCVIHLAAKINIGKDKTGEIFRTNKLGSENVISASIKHKVKRLIYFSSIHTFNPFPLDEVLDETRGLVGSTGSDYDRSKIAGELALAKARVAGIETIVICPTSVFGPKDHNPSLLGGAILDIYNRKIPALITAGYDFVDVRDVARGTILALEKGLDGEKYILGGHYLTLKALAFKIGEIGNVKTTQRVIGLTALKLLLPFIKLQSLFSGKAPALSKDALKILAESNPNVSSEKAIFKLGYEKTNVDDSIKATLQWFEQDSKIKLR